jgi:hypothetical protein
MVIARKLPLHHRAKTRLLATADDLPRRSMRVAAEGKTRVSNLEMQTHNVLMKWQITSTARSSNVDAL